jgi:hypothetical protein
MKGRFSILLVIIKIVRSKEEKRKKCMYPYPVFVLMGRSRKCGEAGGYSKPLLPVDITATNPRFFSSRNPISTSAEQ